MYARPRAARIGLGAILEGETMPTVRYLVRDVDAVLPFYAALGFRQVPALNRMIYGTQMLFCYFFPKRLVKVARKI